ncbi:MAG: hypothetical protein DHS20C14_13600 [Phycisphaeraceae bacterium]|nr:MAG: hypothetical protein DHS20C14_13600 [Phycisphaeraceae bacterium]
MRTQARFATCAAVLVVLALPAKAEILRGIGSDGRLWDVDTRSGEVDFVSRRISSANSLARTPDGLHWTIFSWNGGSGTSPNQLISFDRAGLIVDQIDISHSIDGVRSLTFDAALGAFVVSSLSGAGGIDAGLLWRVDRDNGEAHFLGETGDETVAQGMTTAADGEIHGFFASALVSPAVGGLVGIDPITGVLDDFSTAPDQLPTNAVQPFQSLAYGSDGTLYGVTLLKLGHDDFRDAIYTIDPVTGAESLLHVLDGRYDFRGVEVVPAPPTAALLGLVLLAARRSRA